MPGRDMDSCCTFGVFPKTRLAYYNHYASIQNWVSFTFFCLQFGLGSISKWPHLIPLWRPLS